MAGVDALTGKRLEGFAHVAQSIDKVITTMLGERIMREWVGNPGTKILGENGTQNIIMVWVTIIWMLVEIFEPRFKIRRFQLNEVAREGLVDFTIVGEYRPYAHLAWQQASVFVSVVDGVVRVTASR